MVQEKTISNLTAVVSCVFFCCRLCTHHLYENFSAYKRACEIEVLHTYKQKWAENSIKMMSSKTKLKGFSKAGSSIIATRYLQENITQSILRNTTSFFLIGPHYIGAKALETKWMHFFDANMQYFAKVLKKFNGYGVRSYANLLP